MNSLTYWGRNRDVDGEFPVFLDEVTGEFLTYVYDDPDAIGDLCPCADSEGRWSMDRAPKGLGPRSGDQEISQAIGDGLPLSERI